MKIRTNKQVALIFAAIFTYTIVIGIGSITIVAYAQVEEQETGTEGIPTKMTKVLSCELDPDSGLLCSNSELGLCILRTDLTGVGEGKMWNIMNPTLCEAGE
jgi:hypothetical protein